MALLRTQDGSTLDTASLPTADTPELWHAVASVAPLLDPLEDDEAAVDPAVFTADLILFLRETLKRGRKEPPLNLTFRCAGRIGAVSYWAFSFSPDRGDVPLYALVVHNPPAGEFACVDSEVALPDAGIVRLTPEQAIVAEYVLSDSETLDERYRRQGPQPGDDRED